MLNAKDMISRFNKNWHSNTIKHLHHHLLHNLEIVKKKVRSQQKKMMEYEEN